MVAQGVLADMQTFGDLFARCGGICRDRGHHLAFLARQAGYFHLLRVTLLAIVAPCQLDKDAPRGAAVEPDFACGHPLDGFEQSLGGLAFFDHAARAGQHGVVVRQGVARSGQHQYPRL